MAFRYQNLQRVSSLLPRILSGQACKQCGETILLAHTFERIGRIGAWRGVHVSRLSTEVDISNEVYQHSDLISYLQSTFGHVEGPSHCWVNRSGKSKEFLIKDGTFLLVAGVCLDDHSNSNGDQIHMFEKAKYFQKRYPWLQVLGFHSSPLICSKADQDRLANFIVEEYITFPILLCNKNFPEMAAGSCILLKGLKDPPLYYGTDVDLSDLNEVINDLSKQLEKNASNADKLSSPWSRHLEGFKEPYVSSFLQNLFLYFPACISADGSGNQIFLSDSNHHRVIIFDNNGVIRDVIGSSPGFEDGNFETAKLMRPSGSYYHPSDDCLYIVDSENHAIRRADLGRRVLETLYPSCDDKGKNGSLTWILYKLGIGRDSSMRSVDFDSQAMLFPWHLRKSENGDLLIFNKRFSRLWIMNMGSGVISSVVKGHGNIMELCGQHIMEKTSYLKDLPHEFLQQLVSSSYPSRDISCSGLSSSLVICGESSFICDAVSQRVLIMNRQAGTCSNIEFSNFKILGLPYWVLCPMERAFMKGNVDDEAQVDHIQSFTLLPGKIDVHVKIDIPVDMELVEPPEDSCVWRQVRGAAMEALEMKSDVAPTQKLFKVLPDIACLRVGAAQRWYDELDNLAFEVEPEASSEEETPPLRNLDDGKIQINSVINTSPGTSELIMSAPIYLKLQRSVKTRKDTQEMAAIIADILKPDCTSGTARDTCIRLLLNLNRDLGELVFVKPLRVKLRFDILKPPNAGNSRDIILTDSSVDVNVSLR